MTPRLAVRKIGCQQCRHGIYCFPDRQMLPLAYFSMLAKEMQPPDDSKRQAPSRTLLSCTTTKCLMMRPKPHHRDAAAGGLHGALYLGAQVLLG